MHCILQIMTSNCIAESLQQDGVTLEKKKWFEYGCISWGELVARGWSPGEEPASCYPMVSGLIPLVCKVSFGKILNPKLLLMCWSAPYMAVTAISVWMYCMYELLFGQKHLLNAPKCKCKPMSRSKLLCQHSARTVTPFMVKCHQAANHFVQCEV